MFPVLGYEFMIDEAMDYDAQVKLFELVFLVCDMVFVFSSKKLIK